MSQKKTKVSVCMICKDEEKFLEQCLKSVHDKENVLEIIIVDTGSTDKTKEIALSFPKVKYFYKTFTPWSFRLARNFSISKAKGNWIMYMDADEVFQGEFPHDLPETIFNYKIQNVTDGGDFVNSFCARMIPNIKGVEFMNDVHEIFASTKKELPINLYPHGTIIHYGYTAQVRADKNKLERNLEMLTESYNKKPTYQTAYYLGQETFITGNHERVIELTKHALTIFDPTNALDQTFEPIMYHLLISALIEAKHPHEEIEEFENTLAFKRPNPEICVVLQAYYLGRNDPMKAGFYCMQAMKLKNSPELPVKYNENTVKFVSYIMMGDYYMNVVGDQLAALYWFENAHMGGCSDPSILTRIYQLLPKYKNIPKMDYYLKKLYEVTKDNSFLKELVNVYMSSNSPELEKNAVGMMNQIAGREELQQFKNALIANGKGLIAEEVKEKAMELHRLAKELYTDDLKDVVSVIIPTMMKADPEYLKWNIRQLQANPLVKEIIIVDNSGCGEVEMFLENDTKIRVLLQKENIGVNKAWNLGVAECTSSYYLILNDDCMVNVDALNACVNIVENEKTVNLVTVKTEKGEFDDYAVFKSEDQFNVFTDMNYKYPMCTFGWYIFGRKSAWIPIPSDQFNIFYGDDFIHLMSNVRGFRNVIVLSEKINHQTSTTVEQLYGGLENANGEYRRLLEEERPKFEVILKSVSR